MNSTPATKWPESAARCIGTGLVLASLVGPAAVVAQVSVAPSVQQGGWRSVGPGPGAIEANVVSHAPSHTIYLASYGGGLLKSTNGGATFASIEGGFFPDVSALAMWPHDPNILYVAAGDAIWKTTDGGASWTPTNGFGTAFSMAIDPTNANVVYAGYNGFVTKTIDGGDTWDLAMEGMVNPSVFSLTIDPANPNVLYAGTAGAGGYRSVDGAATWTPLGVDTTVWSVLVDPSDSSVVYAGSNGTGVYRSTDGGVTFARAGSPRVGVVLSLAKSGNRLYAGTATEGVSVSEDGGATWNNTGAAEGLALVLSSDSAGSVFVGTNFEGVFELPAQGERGGRRELGGVEDDVRRHGLGWRRLAWNQLRNCNCQSGYAIAIDPSDDRHVFFSTNDGGLLVTEDGGRTWQDAGLHGLTARATKGIAFDPQEPRRVYVGSFTGSGLFKSEDGGRHWRRRLFGSGYMYAAGVTVDPVDHSVYVSTHQDDDGLWKSTDFGETFTRIDRAPGAPTNEYLGLTGRGIAVDPNHHRTVFQTGPGGVWRSQDAGATWVNVEVESNTQVTVDPVNSHIVYATGQSGVFKSIDGGASFVLKFEEFISKTSSVQIDPAHHNVLYVGTEGDGVFKSTDGGETWSDVNLGLYPDVKGLAMSLDDPDTLFASTPGSVFKTTTGGR